MVLIHKELDLTEATQHACTQDTVAIHGTGQGRKITTTIPGLVVRDIQKFMHPGMHKRDPKI